jgi:hypothetical protein
MRCNDFRRIALAHSLLPPASAPCAPTDMPDPEAARDRLNPADCLHTNDMANQGGVRGTRGTGRRGRSGRQERGA